MGIYIKDMKMPETCFTCKLAHPAYIERSLCCSQTGQIVDAKHAESERLKECPLVELPPHGRLIDADALIKKVEHDTPLSAVFEKTIRRYLENAPTIIPADKEEICTKK